MSVPKALMPVVFAGLLATAGCSGCSGCGSPSKPEEPPVVEAPVPEAPPRKPLTETERLLIGKWKLVRQTPPNNPPYEATDEFRADGTYRYWSRSPIRPGEVVGTGTYRVQGDLLLRTWSTGDAAHNLLIESITEDKLVYSGALDDGQQVMEFVRAREERQ
jgi:hypothetical protein